MGFNFPDEPTLDQIYQFYKWDSQKWISTIGGIGVVTVPPLPALTGLVGLWDAQVTASLTLSGSNIDAVADQSGAGNHLTWAGYGKPVYSATGFNSTKPAFVFDAVGVANAFTNTSFPLGTGNTLTLWYVGKLDTATANAEGVIVSYKGAGQSTDWSNTSSFVLFREYATPNVMTYTKNSIETTHYNPYNEYHRIIVTVDASGVTTFYVDGMVTRSATLNAGSWTSPGILNIGRAYNNNLFWGGPIGEVGIAAGYSNSVKVAELDTYLAIKWGLPPVVATPPTSLTGLVGWWDAKVSASMTLSGADILAVADQSGAGNDLAWSNAKPTYSATGFNVQPAFMLGGAPSGQAFLDSSFALGTGDTLTLWWVGQMNSATSGTDNCGLISYLGAGQTTDWGNRASFVVGRNGVSSQLIMYRDGASGVDHTANANHRVIVTINSGGTQRFYIDGVLQTGAVVPGNWTSPGSLRIGRSYNNSYWGGPIGEIGIATGYSDLATVGGLDLYLKNKWMNPVAAFLARTSGLNSTHVNAYTALIDGLVADGVWDKLDMLHIYATQDAATANLNLIGNIYNATPTNSPTFTADQGYTGAQSGAKHVRTGFTPSTAVSPKFTQNSGHVSMWPLNNLAASWALLMGCNTGSSHVGMHARFGGDLSYFYVNDGSTTNVSNTSSIGHFLANRSTSSATQGYKNGASVVTNNSNTSLAVPTHEVFVAGQNQAGTAFGVDYQMAMASIGSSLTATEAAKFYTRLYAYMISVGAAAVSSAATAFLARTTGLDSLHTAAYTALIDGLVADGVWGKLDILRIYATQDSATALLNLKSSSYPGVIHGSPAFTADRGFTGVESSATVWIDSGFNPSTAGGQYAQNSAHISGWHLGASAYQPPAGYSNSGSTIVTYAWPKWNSDSVCYLRVNVAGNVGGSDAAGVQTPTGFFMANRSASTAVQGYRNAVSILTSSSGSVALLNLNFYELGLNSNGTPVGSGNQQAAFSIGSSLNSTEVTAFYNRLRTYMSAVGVP